MFLKKLFQINKYKACHHGRNDLSLVTNHLYLCESEIPYRNLTCRSVCYAESI